ncbi:hypothetical protein K8352_14920 [Flavobacteriaceae bacterium F89]|uniref:Uncharacterized protein n=1 Tax=Cerina litoralis TaxID=2874477 RepID=A0AAE3EVZ2_9FLAO|nr:hypothetical protein [Cerina litoralis]MCG2462050.1 hypothetical protein [Cerina litoralis]
MDFNIDDIPALDFIVKQCLLKGQIDINGFLNSEFAEKQEVDGLEFIVREQAIDEFVRLLNILEKTGVCERHITKQGQSTHKNDNTYSFQRKGGFTTLYKEHQKEKERIELEYRKTKVDLDLAEKTLKEFPITKFLAWGGFIIAFLLLLKEIYSILT